MNEDIENLKSEILKLKSEITDQDAKFSEKRAQFKNLYMKKEDELQIVNTRLLFLEKENDNLKKEIKDTQSAASIAESFRQEELKMMTNKYKEESATLNKLMRENLKDLNKKLEEKEKKIQMLQSEKSDLMSRLEEKSQEISETTKNLLSKIAHKFKINPPDIFKNNDNETENNDKIDDIDVLQNLVEPYEEDVKMLKDKIRDAYTKIDLLESQSKKYENIDALENELDNIKKKLNIEKDNNNFMKVLMEQSTENNFKNQNLLDRYQNILNNLLTPEQKNEMEKILQLNDNTENNVEFFNSSIRKSQSGGNICTIVELEEEKEELRKISRRNTDISSLKDFPIESSLSINPQQQLMNASLPTTTAAAATATTTSRIVSEKEWSRLQLQLESLKNRSKRATCEMCTNYEDQLQTMQNKFQDCEKEMSKQIQINDNLKQSNNSISSQLKESTERQSTLIDELTQKLTHLSSYSDELRARYEKFRQSTDEHIKELVTERMSMKNRLDIIEKSYDHLLMKRAVKSREMEAEKIELPDNLESAHFELLKSHEQAIEYKATIEHYQDQLHSAELFNKEKESAEQMEREGLFDEYTKEKKELELKVEKLESELQKFKSTRKSTETLEETIRCLKTELDVVKKNYLNIEGENKSLKTRLQALQHELENSESVQKDFVKLSQTLQMQLEELRQEEKEVRWQFEEDVKECVSCKVDFSIKKAQAIQQQQQVQQQQQQQPGSVIIGNNSPITKQQNPSYKRHCRHCGKIFCLSCLKIIQSQSPITGQQRQLYVCKVCHTLLVPDAVPYFSTNATSSTRNN